MSRVTYANTPSTLDQQALRRAPGGGSVAAAEEGMGVNALPGGVYGFTYSPALPNAPLFAERRFRSYETHRAAPRDTSAIGFTDVETAAARALAAPPAKSALFVFTDVEAAASIASSAQEQTVQIQPEPDEKSNVLVKIPYSR